MSLPRKALFALGLVCLPLPAALAQDIPPALIACAIEKRDKTRLECFDREIAAAVQRSAAGVAQTPSRPAPAVAPSAPVAAAPPAAVASAPAAAVAEGHK